MPSLFKPTYTVVNPQTGERVKRRTKKFYGQYRDASGRTRRVPLSPNKTAAQLMLADLVRAAEAGRDASPREARKRPIGDAIDEWEKALYAGRATKRYCQLILYRVRRVALGCKWTTLAGLDASAAEAYLAGRQADDAERMSAKTRNDYADALKSFGGWLVPRRLAANPFAELTRGSVAADRRHDRRALTQPELLRLLATTEASPRLYQGLTGRDRYMLYLTALSTGLRAGELAGLLPVAFAWDDADGPAVYVAARRAKNRRATRQPIPAGIVDVLRPYVGGRPSGELVWPGAWSHDGAEMLQLDLADAGIPYVVDGPDGPLFADFHGLRHTFIAMLDRPDISFKEAMALARHTDPRLTAKVYGRATRQKLAGAADKILAPALAQAGGADRVKVNKGEGQDGSPTLPFAPGGAGPREDAQGGTVGELENKRGRERFPAGDAEIPGNRASLAKVLAQLGISPTVQLLILELVKAQAADHDRQQRDRAA